MQVVVQPYIRTLRPNGLLYDDLDHFYVEFEGWYLLKSQLDRKMRVMIDRN